MSFLPNGELQHFVQPAGSAAITDDIFQVYSLIYYIYLAYLKKFASGTVMIMDKVQAPQG